VALERVGTCSEDDGMPAPKGRHPPSSEGWDREPAQAAGVHSQKLKSTVGEIVMLLTPLT
jgi:hypothetical protein